MNQKIQRFRMLMIDVMPVMCISPILLCMRQKFFIPSRQHYSNVQGFRKNCQCERSYQLDFEVWNLAATLFPQTTGISYSNPDWKVCHPFGSMSLKISTRSQGTELDTNLSRQHYYWVIYVPRTLIPVILESSWSPDQNSFQIISIDSPKEKNYWALFSSAMF